MENKVIDFHVHIFPDSFSSKAISSLENRYDMRFISSPTISGLKSFMSENEIDVSVIQPVATSTGQVKAINDWLIDVVKKNSDIKAFGAYYPQTNGIEDMLKRLKKNGINGIKLHPNFQDFSPDDKSMFFFYENIIMQDMWILFHAGDEVKPVNKLYSTVSSFCNLRKKYPGLKIILAHLGGFKNWDEAEKKILGEDFYLDLAYTFGFLDSKRIKKMIKIHGPGKILFGSDFPLLESRDNLSRFKALDIAEEEKTKILYLNARDKILL